MQHFAANSVSCSIPVVNWDVNCCCGYTPGKMHEISISPIYLTTNSGFPTDTPVSFKCPVIVPLSCSA